MKINLITLFCASDFFSVFVLGFLLRQGWFELGDFNRRGGEKTDLENIKGIWDARMSKRTDVIGSGRRRVLLFFSFWV